MCHGAEPEPFCSDGRRPTPFVLAGEGRSRSLVSDVEITHDGGVEVVDASTFAIIDNEWMVDGMRIMFGSDECMVLAEFQMGAAVIKLLRDLVELLDVDIEGKESTVMVELKLLAEEVGAPGCPCTLVQMLGNIVKGAVDEQDLVFAGLDPFECVDEVKEVIRVEANTIPRGLGYDPGSLTRLVHR